MVYVGGQKIFLKVKGDIVKNSKNEIKDEKKIKIEIKTSSKCEIENNTQKYRRRTEANQYS